MHARAIVRILTGALFVAEGWAKIAGTFVRGGFAGDLPEIARWLIALGELAVGIGLLLGLWTRVACAGGVVLMLAIGMGGIRPGDAGAGWTGWVTPSLSARLAFLLFVLLFTVDAGKTWGLDGAMAKRKEPSRLRT